MYSKIITQTSLANIITLDEAKTQCRVSHSVEDTYITYLVSVAADLAQGYTRKMLSPGNVKCVVDNYQGKILLPYGNPSVINSVLLDGVETTNYEFDDITESLVITDDSILFDKVTVDFDAGYPDFSSIPMSTIHAIKMLVSTMYNTREDLVIGMTIEKAPLAAMVLLNKDKYYVV